MKILLVAGTRPNFIKLSSVVRALQTVPNNFDWAICHTGQHYDDCMSGIFFRELGVPAPQFYEFTGPGTYAEQVSKILCLVAKVVRSYNPDAVMVFGDVNSTLAAALAAKAAGKRVIHVEAGLRCGDWTMPEEINRVTTDSISDVCFASEPSGVSNLRREGHTRFVEMVGDTMIDAAKYAVSVGIIPEPPVAVRGRNYVYATMHRPANVDSHEPLARILEALGVVSKNLPVFLVLHPRTVASIEKFSMSVPWTITTSGPIGFLESLALVRSASVVITDSGGLQSEAPFFRVPCLTMRYNTERPATLSCGNVLVGTRTKRIVEDCMSVLCGGFRSLKGWPDDSAIMWDGKAGERIVKHLVDMEEELV